MAPSGLGSMTLHAPYLEVLVYSAQPFLPLQHPAPVTAFCQLMFHLFQQPGRWLVDLCHGPLHAEWCSLLFADIPLDEWDSVSLGRRAASALLLCQVCNGFWLFQCPLEVIIEMCYHVIHVWFIVFHPRPVTVIRVHAFYCGTSGEGRWTYYFYFSLHRNHKHKSTVDV